MEDKYIWLEELHSKESLAWVEQQNQKTLDHWTKDSRFDSLFDRAMEFLSKKDKLISGSVFNGEVYNLWQDLDHPIGLLRKAPLSSFPSPQWTPLLDLDKYSVDKGIETFFHGIQFLEGHNTALLSLSPQARDSHETFEWDLKSNTFVPKGFYLPLSKDEICWVDPDHVVWTSCERPTTSGYASRAYSWKRGGKPELLLEIPTESMFINAASMRDSHDNPVVFVIHFRSWSDGEFFYWDGSRLINAQLPSSGRISGLYRDRLVIYLEKKWAGFASDSVLLCKTPGKYSGYTEDDFEAIFTPTNTVSLEVLTTGQFGIALAYKDNLKHRVRIWTPEGTTETPIPEGISVASIDTSVDERELFLQAQSFTQPPSWSRWTGTHWQELSVSGKHFQAEDIEARQEWAVSKDGTRVPYWLVYKRDSKFPSPTLQYGYGGFMHAMMPTYNPGVGALWLELGGVFAFTQIRGGSEFGIPWFEAARLKNKQKSYDDFIAISEDLIRKGITTAKQLSIQGRSNGGLLSGATVTQRPDLYGACIIEVPLLDMIRFNQLLSGASWMDEYGDPRDPEMREIILKYSPYQNVEKNPKYPPIFLRTARSDDRVHPAHARKMAAKLQELGHEAWFFEEEIGGHGATPIKDKALQLALLYSFLWKNLGT